MSLRTTRADGFRVTGWLMAFWLMVGSGCGRGDLSGGIVEIAIPDGSRRAEPHGTDVSPRGEWLALADYRSKVEFLDVARGKWDVLPHSEGENDGFGPVAFSSSGRLLATSGPQVITIWEVKSKKRLASLPLARKNSVNALRFIDDDRQLHATLATRESDSDDLFIPYNYGTARWDVASGKRLDAQEFGPHPLTLITSPDGLYGVVYTLKTDPALIHFRSGQRLAELGEGNNNAVFSADGKTLVVCELDGVISIRDVPSGRERRRVEFDPNFDPLLGQLSLSADARLLAVGGYPAQRSATVFDLRTGKILGSVECGPGLSVCHSVKLSPDGLALLTCTGWVGLNDQPIKAELKLWKLPASW